MCTVTIGPLYENQPPSKWDREGWHGFRLACNRDESPSRPAAHPPQRRAYGRRTAILPVDPVSDGTWISVNDRGLAMTLLNVYESDPASTPGGDGIESPDDESSSVMVIASRSAPRVRSRGVLIPLLLGCEDAENATRLAREIDPQSFPPFRLLIADRYTLAEVRGDGRRIHVQSSPLTPLPLLYTSSGLGDRVVEPPRRELFEEFLNQEGDWSTVQDAFHRHRWPDRPDVSVNMSRESSRTVSYTVVEVARREVRLRYYPDAPDQAVQPSQMALSDRPAGAI